MCDMFILNPVQDEQGAVWSFCVLKAHSLPFVSIVYTDCWEISWLESKWETLLVGMIARILDLWGIKMIVGF